MYHWVCTVQWICPNQLQALASTGKTLQMKHSSLWQDPHQNCKWGYTKATTEANEEAREMDVPTQHGRRKIIAQANGIVKCTLSLRKCSSSHRHENDTKTKLFGAPPNPTLHLNWKMPHEHKLITCCACGVGMVQGMWYKYIPLPAYLAHVHMWVHDTWYMSRKCTVKTYGVQTQVWFGLFTPKHFFFGTPFVKRLQGQVYKQPLDKSNC